MKLPKGSRGSRARNRKHGVRGHVPIRVHRCEWLEPRELLSADPLYRVNAGGEQISATPLDWLVDTNASGSAFSNYTPGADYSRTNTTGASIDLSHPSVPAGAPEAIFQTQRFDRPNQPNLEWDFPVQPGEYEVRLYFSEIRPGAFAVGKREFDVVIEGEKVLDNYDIFEEAGALAGIVETFVVTSDETLDIDFLRNTGKNDPTVMGIEILPVGAQASTASAYFAAAPGGGIVTSSTFKPGSFRLENTSEAGQQIESLTIDLGTGFLPDMVFDPFGGAGDAVAKPFSPDAGAVETGQSGVAYSGEHDGGFDTLEVTFVDFDPGELFTFSIDVDPTSIQGTSQPGPGHSGSVSGFELAGATVTVNYNDGASLTARLLPVDGSDVNAEVFLHDASTTPTSISLLGVPGVPTIVDSAGQTLRVTGVPGDEVRVIQAESGLFLGPAPFDLDPFETNRVLSVTHLNDTIGPSGFVDVAVTLSDSHVKGGVNHFFVAVEDTNGVGGALSNVITVALNDLPPGSNTGALESPSISSVAVSPSVTATAPVTVTAQVTDVASEIVRVEGFLNVAGPPGSGLPLVAADGSFDSASETAFGVINANLFAAIPVGTHTILLRAQNAAGAWSEVASATLTKLPSSGAALIALSGSDPAGSSAEDAPAVQDAPAVDVDRFEALALLIRGRELGASTDRDAAFEDYENAGGDVADGGGFTELPAFR